MLELKGSRKGALRPAGRQKRPPLTGRRHLQSLGAASSTAGRFWLLALSARILCTASSSP